MSWFMNCDLTTIVRIRISPAFGVAFDSCAASMTGVAIDCFAAATTGSASAILSSSVLIAFRSRAIDRSLFSENFRLTS
jgi:hypothetical protein